MSKIAEMITPENCPSEIAVVYQTIDHLHQACPNHSGDWYFSGDYPTPGGNRLVNGALWNGMRKGLIPKSICRVTKDKDLDASAGHVVGSIFL